MMWRTFVLVVAVAFSLRRAPARVIQDTSTKIFGTDFVEQQQKLLEEFSSAVTERVATVTSNPNHWTCQCTYHSCGGFFEQTGAVCVDSKAAEDELTCSTARRKKCTPIKMYTGSSFVRVQPEIPLHKLGDSSIKDAPEAAEDICMLEGLEREEIYQSAMQWKGDEKTIPGRAYIGTAHGVSLTWPGRAHHRFGTLSSGPLCHSLDPRFRPWYLPAMSPNKAVVFILDASAKEAANRTVEAILSTLSHSDVLGVIHFSVGLNNDREDSVETPALWEGTDENKLSGIYAAGEASAVGMSQAFQQAFNMLGKVSSQEKDTMVVFLAYGGIDAKSSNLLLSEIDTYQDKLEHPANILTFTFKGPGSGDGFSRKVACQNNGIWTPISDSGNPDLSNYMSFLTLPVEHAPSEPNIVHWTPIYKDVDQLGDTITLAKPFFQDFKCNRGERRRLRGVVGIDIQANELTRTQKDEYNKKFLKTISNNLSIRDVDNLECELQILRENTRSECPGDLPTTIPLQHYDDYFIIFKEKLSYSDAEQKCTKLHHVLATVATEEVQALLSTSVPNEGAWIGYKMQNNSWSWIGSNATVVSMAFWANRGQGSGRCALIDNRGTLTNIMKEDCQEKRQFICQYTDSPPSEQSSHLHQVEKTARMCNRKECTAVELLNTGSINGSLLCNWNQAGGSSDVSQDVICCSSSEDNNICNVANTLSSMTIMVIVIMVVVCMLLVIGGFLVWRTSHPALHPLPPIVAADIITGSKSLGSGATGRVKEGEYNGQAVAIKVFSPQKKEDFSRECEIFRRIPHHENIIRLLGVHNNSNEVENGEMCLVLELMTMNLDDFINHEVHRRDLRYRDLLQIFLQISRGLDHLHRAKVVHRDLKPQNVLVKIEDKDPTPPYSVKLCDFGHGKTCLKESITQSGVRGTFGYMSPELMQMCYNAEGDRLTVRPATDIYSFGIVMCECIVGVEAFTERDWEMPEGLKDLILECKHYDDKLRPKASEVSSQLRRLLNSGWASHCVFSAKRLETVD